MKGKPWIVEDENRLKHMLQAGKSVRVIAKVMGKTRDYVRIKIARLSIEVVVHAEKSRGLLLLLYLCLRKLCAKKLVVLDW